MTIYEVRVGQSAHVVFIADGAPHGWLDMLVEDEAAVERVRGWILSGHTVTLVTDAPTEDHECTITCPPTSRVVHAPTEDLSFSISSAAEMFTDPAEDGHECGNCEGVDPATCMTSPTEDGASGGQDGRASWWEGRCLMAEARAQGLAIDLAQERKITDALAADLKWSNEERASLAAEVERLAAKLERVQDVLRDLDDDDDIRVGLVRYALDREDA